jgi:hypothetical protein
MPKTSNDEGPAAGSNLVRTRRPPPGVAHPIKELAEETGERPTYVRDTITDARRRYGLLTTAGQGRAGGTLTEKARELMKARSNPDQEAANGQ